MASNAVPEGLSSQEAQRRLLEELATLISQSSTVNWLKEIRNNPFSVICSILVAYAGLVLVIFYAVSAGERSPVILFQGLLLIFLSAFNICLFGGEVYILRTQKIRHLIVRLKSVFDRPCPWRVTDYPKSSISTLRGHLTTPAYRDGALVNVPVSLLVHGDVIELASGVPCPANAVLLNPKPGAEMEHVAMEEVLPDDLFSNYSPPEDIVNFLPKVKPIKLVVEDSPILTPLKSSIQKVRRCNLLTMDGMFCIWYIGAVFAVYLFSLVVNLIRYFALPNDFEGSWPELLLGGPVYTCLPVLFLQLPLLWNFTNLYGTARISMLVENGPHFFKATGVRRIKGFLQTLVAMARLVCVFDRYPDYWIFHVLGAITSVCAVDKEYVLTSGFPSPERVFFLRTEEINSDDKIHFDGKQVVAMPDVKYNLPPDVSHSMIKVEITSDSGEGVEDSIASTTVSGSGRPQGVSVEQQAVETQFLNTTPDVSPGNSILPSSQMDTLSTLSNFSDTTPFEVVTEIINLSPDPNSPSGMAFDDVCWQDHIGSLKPIGLNLLTTSHLGAKLPFHPGFSSELQLHLHKSSCSCSLSLEIGVTEYYSRKFVKETVIHIISNLQRALRRRSTATTFVNHNSTVHPHILSSVVRDCELERTLVMSRGSGDLIALCSTDFWDGKELQPMTNIERASIIDYYNCRSLSSYCIALSYSPMPPHSSSWPGSEVGMYVPPSYLEQAQDDVTAKFKRARKSHSSEAENAFSSLQGQVFLGLVCLQFRPKQDVVALVEDLYTAGIRFVHFTAESELRGKIFAQKLGVEADWNCFISLAEPMDGDEESLDGAESDGSSESGDSSLSSSILSVFHLAMSHKRARLPKGIKNIRPHIEKVDNVPLLVSLFTNCTAETISEMIEIMQENSEVVLCLGNAWNHKNIGIFSQADISLSLVPRYLDLATCTVTETCGLSTSTSSQNAGSTPSHHKAWPSPLELASYLNSTSCQLCFGRENDVSLLALITESRCILASVRLGLLFCVESLLALTLLFLLATLFFLPPPLSGGHLFWLLLFIIPLITTSFLATPLDPATRTLMPCKTKELFSNGWLILSEFLLLFGLTAVVLLILFGVTLTQICTRDIVNSTCHPLLGDRAPNSTSPWNGWGGEAGQGFLLAQNVTVFFASLYLVVLSIRYVHRTQPIWRLWRFISWQYLLVVIAMVVLQAVYCVVAQVISNRNLPVISGLGSVPPSVWCIGFVWPFVMVVMAEVFKHIDKKKLFEAQTLLRLQFGTKLGMHSPV